MSSGGEHASAGVAQPLTGWHAIAAKVSKFSVVGALSGLLYVVFTSLAINGLGIEARYASLIAYAGVMPVNFVLQRSFTFRSDGKAMGDLTRYLIAQGVSAFVCFLAMLLAVDGFGLHYTIGNAVGIVLVPFVTYFVLDRWVFAEQAPQSLR